VDSGGEERKESTLVGLGEGSAGPDKVVLFKGVDASNQSDLFRASFSSVDKDLNREGQRSCILPVKLDQAQR
jgi:hypothetical protein